MDLAVNTPDAEHTARISAYLDGEMADAERAAFEAELATDASLASEVRLLGAVRSTIRNRADRLREPVPIELERSIRLALAKEVERETAEAEHKAAPAKAPFLQLLIEFLSKPALSIPLGLSVAAAAVIVVMLTSTSRNPELMVGSGVDLCHDSYTNFQKVQRGELKLAMATSDNNHLASFFRDQGVKYNVHFPKISAELQGGVVSTHHGRKFAHLVYATGDHLVYIFEVDAESVHSFDAEPHRDVVAQMVNKQWHHDERPGTGNLLMWESNTVVCSAVSDLQTRDFSALLSAE
jgi:hypothetical protein